MLVVQQNCGKGYKCTFFELKTALSPGASMVCIQELFIGNRTISYSRFNLYWLVDGRNQRDIQVLTTVQKDIANNVIFDNRSDLANDPYYLVLDIKKLHLRTRKPIQKTRVVNIYDNSVGQECTWQGHTAVAQRAIQDIGWNNIIRGHVLLLGDINAHSPS